MLSGARKVTISGWYGVGNIGDEAILEAVINDVRSVIPEPEITVLSINPEHTRRYHPGVRSVAQPPRRLYRFPFRAFRGGVSTVVATVRAFRECDIFILGGGGFVADWQPEAPDQWLRQLKWAKKSGAITMLYAVGAGPITTEKGKATVRKFLNYADAITVRDEPSRQALLGCGVPAGSVRTTADPVFGLPLRPQSLPVKRDVVAILHPYYHIERYWPGRNKEFAEFRDALGSWLAQTARDYSVALVPFMEADEAFLLTLAENCCPHRVEVMRTPRTPQQAIDIIGTAQLVVSMRYHGIILSVLAEKPVLGIVLHHKQDCLLRDIGLREFAEEIGDGTLWRQSQVNVERMYENSKKALEAPKQFFSQNCVWGSVQSVSNINLRVLSDAIARAW